MSRMTVYAPRAIIPTNRHDHARTMIFTEAESRCTDCGARWLMDNRGRWTCIMAGHWPPRMSR